MKLVNDWRAVLKHAWSVRFALAAISGAALPTFAALIARLKRRRRSARFALNSG